MTGRIDAEDLEYDGAREKANIEAQMMEFQVRRPSRRGSSGYGTARGAPYQEPAPRTILSRLGFRTGEGDDADDQLHGPGRLGAVKRPQRFPMKVHFVWGFCTGAQGA